MGYTTLNKDEKEEEKKVLILFTPTFLPFGQEVSLAQRARSIPIFPRKKGCAFLCNREFQEISYYTRNCSLITVHTLCKLQSHLAQSNYIATLLSPFIHL